MLSTPSEGLKSLQRWILRRCFTDEMVSPSAYAYRPHRSIRDCATVHRGARWLVKFDLQDFFRTITEARVYELFRALGYGQVVAFELARLVTFLPDENARRNIQGLYREQVRAKIGGQKTPDLGLMVDYSAGPYPKYRTREGEVIRGVLPQGAPTSGMIANICTGSLDSSLEELASEWPDMRYTRYCDDLFFSTTNPDFDRSKAEILIRDVGRAVMRNGFRLNRQKTKVVPPGSKKLILGLQVDDYVRLDTVFKRNMAYHIRGIAKFGFQQHIAHLNGAPPITSFLNHLQGQIAFAKGIEPGYGKHCENELLRALKAPPVG